MDEIYMLNFRTENKNKEGSIFGLYGNDFYSLSINIEIINNQYHRSLTKGRKDCTIRTGDNPLHALLKYGESYGSFSCRQRDMRFIKLSMPGSYTPRIYRPFLNGSNILSLGDRREIDELKKEVFQYPDLFPYDNSILLSGLNQLAILKEMLLSILINIYPTKKNMKTSGNSIKNLLVLSCIEVETQLKGIYRANENNGGGKYTTNQYVKLKNIMQLDKFSVKFPFYPEIKSIIPFKNWEDSNPTKSLFWYNSYNSIKHNSAVEFDKATLQNAIYSICAVAILIRAQYGRYVPFWKEEIGSFFAITDSTKWNMAQRIVPPLIGNHWLENKIGF